LTGNRRRMTAPASQSAGFTLLEVLTAFVIVGLTLAALVGMFETGLAGVSRAEKHAIGLMLAESRLAEIGTTVPLQTGHREGDFAAYRWHTTIAPMAPAADTSTSVVESYRVDVEVRERGALAAAARPLVHLKTVRLGIRRRIDQ
jgi:general secretion pathway protein I